MEGPRASFASVGQDGAASVVRQGGARSTTAHLKREDSRAGGMRFPSFAAPAREVSFAGARGGAGRLAREDSRTSGMGGISRFPSFAAPSRDPSFAGGPRGTLAREDSRAGGMRFPSFAAPALKGEPPGGHAPRRFSPVCLRFSLLFFIVIIVFSGYFNYDLPGITSDQLKAPPLALSQTLFGLLFSVYAIPNILLPLLSGAFYDRLGVWRGVLVIGGTISFGIILVAIGVRADSYAGMLFGRVIYGLGGESLYVGIDVLTTTWFKGSELGLAYGLVQAAGQAGSFVVFATTPKLIEAAGGNYYVAYIVGALISVFALGMLVVGRFVDLVRDRNAREDEAAAEAAEAAAGGKAVHEEEGEDPEEAPLLEAPESGGGCRGACIRALLSRPSTFMGFHHLITLPFEFWCHLIGIAVYSGSYFTFLAFGSDFLQSKYGYTTEKSGLVVGIVSLSSVVLSPLSGLALDKLGGSEIAAFVFMSTSIVVFGLLGFVEMASPVPVIALGGICYGVLPSALYPLLAECVPEEAFPQVYAILTAAINVVLSASMALAGVLSDADPEGTAGARRRLFGGAPPHFLGSSGSSSSGGGRAAQEIIENTTEFAAPPDYTLVFVLFTAYMIIGSLTTGWVAWRHLQKWWAGRTALGYGEAHPLLGAADGGPRPSPLPRRTSALTSPQLQQLRGVAEAPEGEEDGAEDAGLGASRRPLR